MEKRTLTITINSDLEHDLRSIAKGNLDSYQGETLNFQRADEFFSMLTGNRWRLLQELMLVSGATVRDLSKNLGRDVRRVHDDIVVLRDLGLIKRGVGGSTFCPFADIHVDIHVESMAA